jgi:hypothetical protein
VRLPAEKLARAAFVPCGIAVAAIAACLAAVGWGAPPPAAQYASVAIEGVPHVRQKPDFCGEACVAMVLGQLGHQGDQDWVFNQSGLDPSAGRGCYTRELTQAMTNIGFRRVAASGTVAADKPAELEAHFRALHADLAAGIPSIVCMRYDSRPDATEHFRLVLGYDARTDEIIFHEPAHDDGAGRRMKRQALLALWPLKYEPQRWTVIRLRLEPGTLAAVEPGEGFTDADFAQHVHALKKRLPPDGFHVVLQKPFVVIGDEEAEVVRRRAVQTVKWAVDRVKLDFFSRDPEHIIDVWLFKDKASYDKHAAEMFGDRPTTPFGYYSPRHKALVMNISTGGGTLVHEIVHPFVASNFPECPSWFNEGLASLYEQCGDNAGHIWGYTNWRLRGLQRAIDQKTVPPFEQLCNTTTRQFYDDDKGTNYSQARYLCYYLQEHGLLVKYYHEFRRNARNDPTGYATLKRVLGEDDMAAFQKRWEAYVMGLKF